MPEAEHLKGAEEIIEVSAHITNTRHVLGSSGSSGSREAFGGVATVLPNRSRLEG